MAENKIKNFRKIVWAHYKKFGRHDLPWRKTRNPYKILVSEVMLQQTQVKRVLEFYAEFMRHYPTAKKLATAPLSEVLKNWQGLGYNRRAKMLHQAAARFNLAELEELPGVGPYTARAIAAFAFNQDVVMIETNIRTAIIHHFFPKKKKVSDKEIEKILEQALPRGKSREWYCALMDYGAFLKKTGIKLNAKRPNYVKQSKFVGSNREARGAILRELAKGEFTLPHIINLLGSSRRTQLRAALTALQKERLVQKRREHFSLAE